MILHRSIIFLILFLLSGSLSIAHVRLDYPEGGEAFETNEVIAIEWTILIDHGDCNWDLLLSIDGGTSWDTIVSNLPKSSDTYPWVTDNNVTTQGMIRVVQDNDSYGNYWDDSDNFTISIAASLPENSFSTEILTLNSPYPNPGSDVIYLSFALSESSRVTIDIFDLSGRKIETLINEHLPVGDYRFAWNSQGTKPGNYLCRFKTGTQMYVQRLIRH